MAALEDLTDAELRRQLKYYDVVPGPITETTRALYIKKLRNLKGFEVTPAKAVKSKKNATPPSKSSRKSVSSRPSTHSFGFSSDESENEGMKLRNRGSNTSLQRKRKQSNVTQDVRKSVSSPAHNLQNNSSPSRVTPPAKITNGYSDDSDDEGDSREDSWVQMTSTVTNTSPGLLSWNSPNSVITRRRSLRNYTTQHNDNSNSSTPLNSAEADSSTDNVGDGSLQGSYSGAVRYPGLSKQEWKNGGDCYRRTALNNAYQKESNNKKVTTDSDEQNNAKSASRESIFKRIKSYFSSSNAEQHSASGFTQSKEPAPRSWSLQCAYLLPACTIIFFCTLGLLYVTMRTDDIGLGMLQGSNTVSDQQAAMVNANAIYEILATRAGDNICQGSDESNLMSLSEIRSSMATQLDQSSILKTLQLIKEHPEWNIFLYKDDQSALLQGSDSVSDTKYLETTSPILPTLCRFQRAIQKVLLRVFIVVAICLSLWLLVLYRQYRLRKHEEERQEMFTLISKILDILRKQHETSLDDREVDPYLPIIHVRDMILLPAERRKKSKVWEMAVRFISASESRVRVETQRVSGEDFSVWRWIQVNSPGKRQQTPKRTWQGEAFPPNQSINSPIICPAPCLKIRNMFDPDMETEKDWHLEIQDSILEKCTSNNDIQSMRVEKDSKEGLIYLKCGSPKEAGVAYQSLHGSWFDGRLVTVKFLKLQRYHTRYPDTINENAPMKKFFPRKISTFSAPDANTSGAFLTSTPLKST